MTPQIQLLTDTIRQTSYDLHTYLRNGLLEKVYENGLANRLRKQGLNVKQQHPISVRDEDGTVLGEYFADLYVEGQIIVELKTAKNLADEHIAQVLAYLRATGLQHGVLVNFGSPKLQIKKLIL
ncbi:GxxExxY protein [Pelagicoccus albus]|uniref:GxxExxY protein n=1 Tax=Pelagicoccus albus TaxID=415222 RepID=A0A7X1B7H8_9BACT|nr:GxxExxY protein [Pelagicoccus albus]MBC2607105.1 GxxExxY protein [Pelagicoccus albus]